MQTLRTLVAASLGAAFLAACGAQLGAPPATQLSSNRVGSSSILGNGQALYVVNEPESGTMGTVTVYDSAGLVRTITDGIRGPISVAVDGSGQVYVANFTANTVTVYDGRGKSLVRTITRNLLRPSRLAFDSKGNLYVIRQNEVNIYLNGKARIMHSIKIQAANAIALDSQDNLYVSTGNGNTVNVYAPGSKTPTRTITQGIDDPGSLALDSAGNLYVGNADSKSFCGDITVYAAGSKSVLRTIKQGVCEPASLAFDSNGNLYVANVSEGSLGNNITVYPPGGGTVLRTITEGLSGPNSLVFDKFGNLYVANAYGADVTVYAPGTTSVLHTFRNGIYGPISIAIGI